MKSRRSFIAQLGAAAALLAADASDGAALVPSGIAALIHAQNAGCAFMPGT